MTVLERMRARMRRPRTLELPISAYGKLPVYKDFLRQGSSSAGAQSMRRWLDQGWSHHWAPNSLYSGIQPGLHSFVLDDGPQGSFSIGALWGSSDEGGLRSFPFVVVAELSSHGGTRLPDLQTLDLALQARRRGKTLARRLGEADDRNTAIQTLRRYRLALSQRHPADLNDEMTSAFGRFTAQDLAEDLYGQRAAAVCFLRRAVERVLETQAWRIPLGDQLEPAMQLAFWCSVAGRQRLARNRTPSTGFLLLVGEKSATLIQRPRRAEDVFALHPEAPAYEFVDDLQFPEPSSTDEEIPGSRGAERPSVDKTPLVEILRDPGRWLEA